MDLIATCARHYEADAGDELVGLLEKLGDSESRFSKTGISGIITAETTLGANDAIVALRARLEQEPWEFRYLLRIIPVHVTSATNAQDIASVAENLAACIGESETYRITLSKRNSGQKGSEIISAIADRIHRKVCLDTPDWVVLVEVLGGIAGISVIRPDGVLSVSKEKMVSSDQDYGALD